MDNTLDDCHGPVFVVGMNGSGTTMMLDHLGQHPDLYAFQLETYILPYYLESERKYGDLENDTNFRKLWDDMRSSYPFRRKNAGRAMELPTDWAGVRRSAAGVFDRLMRIFVERSGKKRWSEKTPMHVMHIAKLAACFPEARFIHMLRDGRDCAASDHRRWGRHPAGTIFRWKYVVAEGRRQGGSIGGRYLEMRYEDVTADPINHMSLACKFVGLEFHERVLSATRVRGQMTGQGPKTIVRNQRRNQAYFDVPRQRSLEQIAGRRLTELGYETLYAEGDADPSRLVRAWWVVHDTYRVLTRQIWMKLTVQRRMTWALFFSRLRVILRSQRSIRRDRS